MDLHGHRIILGSGSPRRRELLGGLGFGFEIDTGNSFVESYSPDMQHHEIPVRMSEGKSFGFHRPLADNEILVTADTMVLCGNEVLGKPHDFEDAVRMLRLLSGNMHTVVSAVTIRNNLRHTTFTDEANVWFNELTDNEIRYYIESYHPFDKAGAYGVQEWIGYVGIKKIEGSFYTIMGLPVHLVYSELKEFLR